MHHQKVSLRAEYRQQEKQRVEDSTTLGEKFRQLKSLTVCLKHFGPQGLTKTGEMKYTFNVAHAKSVFRFDCPNSECVQGDFDLSAELAKAIATRRKTLSGEIVCQGWRNKTTIGQMHCNNLLRYKLSLEY